MEWDGSLKEGICRGTTDTKRHLNGNMKIYYCKTFWNTYFYGRNLVVSVDIVRVISPNRHFIPPCKTTRARIVLHFFESLVNRDQEHLQYNRLLPKLLVFLHNMILSHVLKISISYIIKFGEIKLVSS